MSSQISMGIEIARRQLAGSAGPPGLTKLQQECPWFRDATWGNLRAYLLHTAESISRVSWMGSCKNYFNKAIFIMSSYLLSHWNYKIAAVPETWKPYWWAFLCWLIHRKNFFTLLYSVVLTCFQTTVKTSEFPTFQRHLLCVTFASLMDRSKQENEKSF